MDTDAQNTADQSEPHRIEIPGDTLIPDSELAKMWRCHDRTLYRYEREQDGLPFAFVGGRKYRPLNACNAWLARRVKSPNPSSQRPK